MPRWWAEPGSPGRRWSMLAALALVAALAPLAAPGLWQGHDLMFEYVRGAQYAAALADQGFPPRWAPDFARGYGYPIFLYFPHTFLLVTTALGAVVGWVAAVKLTLATLLLLGTLGVWTTVRRHASPAAAAVAAATWACSPYLGYDVWVRSAFAEATALCLLPWVVWAVDVLLGPLPATRRQQLAATAVGAVFAVSHNPTVLLAMPLLAAATATALASPGRPRPARVKAGALAVAGAGVLAAFYVGPAFSELGAIRMQWDPHGRFGVLQNLLWSQAAAAGGGSATERAAWAVTAVVGGVSAVAVAARRLPGATRPAAAAGLVAAFCLVLATAVAAPVWQAVPALWKVQFPSRLLGPAWLSVAALVAVGAECLWRTSGPTRHSRGLVAGLAVTIALAATLHLSLPWSSARRLPMTGLDTSGAFLRRAHITSTVVDEFMPRGVTRLPSTPAEPTFGFTVAGASIVEAPATGLDRDAVLDTREAGTLLVRRFAFAGWRLLVDGRPVEPALTSFGTMKVELPPGRHAVALRWEDPPLRRAFGWASGLGLAAWLALWASSRRRTPTGLAGGSASPGAAEHR